MRTKIDPDKIGLLIGPGGKNVRMIQETTGTVIEIEDDGTVTVASEDEERAKAAMAHIEACTATVQIGKIYDGRVASIKDFGAFVENPAWPRWAVPYQRVVQRFRQPGVPDVCQVGDVMKVLVIDIDEHDRVKLSRRRALEELGIEDDIANRPPPEEGAEADRPRDGRWRPRTR